MNEPRHFNTAEIDWKKSRLDLCHELGMNLPLIRAIQNHVFGHPGPTLYWSLRYGGLAWDAVDWEAESDSMIAERLQVQPFVVRQYRCRNCKPAPTSLKNRKGRKMVIDPEALAKVDWANYGDTEISEQLGVCRERIRQLRMEAGVQCRFHRFSRIGAKIARWMLENRDRINGMAGRDMIAVCPHKTHDSHMRKLVRQACRILGIQLTWENATKKHTSKYALLNFRLPNSVLADVWGMNASCVANCRNQNHQQLSDWRFGGFCRRPADLPDFQEALHEEVFKATKAGVVVDIENLQLRYGAIRLQETVDRASVS
jgi:hypothetical protein